MAIPPASSEQPGPTAPLGEANPLATRIVNAAELLHGARELLIDHRGSLYRLLLTKNDRLVLQK